MLLIYFIHRLSNRRFESSTSSYPSTSTRSPSPPPPRPRPAAAPGRPILGGAGRQNVAEGGGVGRGGPAVGPGRPGLQGWGFGRQNVGAAGAG
ncbi:hypothetical protein CJF32_00004424 [Rutstroemia sp. NJR-2017a WRK4]|nr:hypothetical protein CJF32_00004424 [Rutstroemia sp. NJR-2017a WRK4]